MVGNDGLELPLGTVTLLLADMEGSTRLWEEHGADMPAAIAAIDQLVDDCVARHHGVRPVEQGQGDSFVAGFARASDAVACALEIQRRTVEGLVHFRMGLHTGEVQLRDAGNYIGPAINRAARLRDAGHGGQILLSQTTADLAAETDLGDDITLVDRGVHTLRDLGRPEHVWEIVDTHTASVGAPRPLRGLGGVPGNLGAQLTAFVGRVDEIAAIHKLLDDARLLTLTGAGGIGKTRLATHVAAGRLDRHRGGVWIADLAPVYESDAVAEAICDALGAARSMSARETLVRHIGSSETLLILDNCEHLIEGAAVTAEALLRACPALTVIATSREPLGVSGEVTYRVPSLDAHDAHALFLERARRARPQFVVDEVAEREVQDICERLEGMPLAIELAAARLRTLTTKQIASGLHDRFRLLVGGGRTAVPRHQTLQASVDWSYALLLEVERQVLDRLSVFAGGFTLGAAEAVCSGDGLEAHHVFDVLMQLVDKSLVVQDPEAGRFTLLETVRQYAATRLADSGTADDVRRQQYAYVLELCRLGDDPTGYRRAIDGDYDNVRRALQWAEDNDDPSLLGRLASRLYLYWSNGFQLPDGARWHARVLERVTDARHRVTALGRYSLLLFFVGAFAESDDAAAEAISLARDLDDKRVLLWTLMNTSHGYGARPKHIEEARDLALAIDDRAGFAWASFQGAWVQLGINAGDVGSAFDDARQVALESGSPWVVHMTDHAKLVQRIALGEVATVLGDVDRLCERGLAEREITMTPTMLAISALLHEAVGDSVGADRVLAVIDAHIRDDGLPGAVFRRMAAHAFVRATRREFDAALDAFVTAETAVLPPHDEATSLAMRATVEAIAGRYGDAIAHATRSSELAPDTTRRDPLWGLTPDYPLALAFRGVGDRERAEASCHRAIAEIADRPVPVFSGAGPVALRAALHLDAGNVEEAARLAAAVHSYARRAGCDVSRLQATTAPVDVQACRLALGDARFDELWSEGEAMPWEEAIAYALRGRGARGGRKRATSGWASLTPTERQVAELVASGASNRVVADRLFMSVATVKSHLTHAYAKLRVTSRAELAAAYTRLREQA